MKGSLFYYIYTMHSKMRFNCFLHRAVCCFCLLDVRAGFRINEVGRVIYGFMFIAPEKQFEVELEAIRVYCARCVDVLKY